jgi:hypothetical protein
MLSFYRPAQNLFLLYGPRRVDVPHLRAANQ